MSLSNPFARSAVTDVEDGELARRAQRGDREALESLICRHQAWVYNIVRRMLYWPQDSEDTTQEILLKVIRKLSTFEGRSSFRTWLYRVVVNHILNMKRGTSDAWTFERYKTTLDALPDMDLPDPNAVPVDVQLLVEEAKIGCTSAVLLCLDREQRLIVVLSEIFGVTDAIGAELFNISRDNYRQKLSRARRDLHSFLHNQCGLMNPANPCRCAKKTQAFIRAGYLDPKKLLFVREHVSRVRQVAEARLDHLDSLHAAFVELQRDHPFHESPDFVASLRSLIGRATFRETLDLD